jgi:ribosome biogenesis protein BMS1
VPTAQRNATYLQKRAVVMEPEEKRAVALLQQIQALRKDKIHKRDEKKKEQREVYKKKVAKLDETKGERRKEERREQLKSASIKSKRAAESEGGRHGKKQRRE